MTTTASARFAIAPLDVPQSLRLARMGPGDFTATQTESSLTKVFDLDSGVHRATYRTVDGELEVTIEGPTAAAILGALAPHYPPEDGYAAFAPDHRLVKELHHSRPGLRFLRVPWLFDAAASVILQQRVKYIEAARDFYAVARRFGTKSELGHAFPTARKLARLLPAQIQTAGVDRHRAAALVQLARAQAIHQALETGTLDEIRARLLALPGIGPWTVEMLMAWAYGDPDAVPLGDYGLPSVVCWLLAREPRGDDARMLELLAPYRGQRGRVARMLSSAGVSPPF